MDGSATFNSQAVDMEEEIGEEGPGGGVQECRAEGEEEVGEEDAGGTRQRSRRS